MDFIAIDFETANSHPLSACAIGIAVAKNLKIVETRHFLIRPTKLLFHWYNIYIHGITKEMVVNEPKFDKIWPLLSDYFKQGMVFAHNATFDMSVLRCLMNKYHISDFPSFNYCCSVNISKKTWEGLSNYKLPTVSKFLNIDLAHHDPEEDARACATIVLEALKKTNVKSVDELLLKYNLAKHKFSKSQVPKAKSQKPKTR